LAFLGVEKRIINVLHHIVQNSDWIWGKLTEKYLFITSLVDVNLFFVFRKVSHEPNSLVFNLLIVTISEEELFSYKFLIVFRASIRGLIIDEELSGSFRV